jgi:hypothetical protein
MKAWEEERAFLAAAWVKRSDHDPFSALEDEALLVLEVLLAFVGVEGVEGNWVLALVERSLLVGLKGIESYFAG